MKAMRAHQVRRLASLVQTKREVMERIKADAERRDPQHRKPLVVLRFRGQAPNGGRRQALEPGGGRGHTDVALAEEEPRPRSP